MKRKALGGSQGVPLQRGFLALYARASGAFFVEADADAFAAKTFLTKNPFDLDLAQPFAFHIGQFEVFEHQLDDLVEAHLGLVIVDSRLIARLLIALAVLPLADD